MLGVLISTVLGVQELCGYNKANTKQYSYYSGIMVDLKLSFKENFNLHRKVSDIDRDKVNNCRPQYRKSCIGRDKVTYE